MNCKLKLKELEEKAREIFKEDFIGLVEACAVFGKTLKDSELGNFCSFSMKEDLLKSYAKDGFCLFTVPKRMTVEEICLMAPKLFVFNLSDREIFSLKKEIIKPGYYLVKKEPRRLSSGGLMMREMGMVVEQNPKLSEAMYIYALCHLAGRRRTLIEKICILCREEVERRCGKARLCFQKDLNSAIRIGAWLNQLSLPNVLPIKRA